MSFFFFLLYLAASYLYPGEFFPQLASYRLTLWIGVLGLAASLLSLVMGGKLTMQLQPLLLMCGLIVSMILSVMWADRWLGAPLSVIESFGPTITMFLLAICNITSIRRLRVTAMTIVVLTLLLALQGAAAYNF